MKRKTLRLLAGFCWVTFAWTFAAAPADALTQGQAASLPLPALTKEVFGEFGSIIVDAKRPERPNDPLKPIRFMEFYTRPEFGALFGVCEAKRIQVFFDEKGVPANFGTLDIYGNAGGLKALVPFPTTYDRKAAMAEQEATCRAATDVHKYFYSQTYKRAVLSARAVQLLADGYKPGQTPNFKFTCHLAYADCSSGNQRDTVLSQVKVDNLDYAEPVICQKHKVVVGEDFGPNGCFLARLKMHPAISNSLDLEIDYGPDHELRVKSAVFSGSER